MCEISISFKVNFLVAGTHYSSLGAIVTGSGYTLAKIPLPLVKSSDILPNLEREWELDNGKIVKITSEWLSTPIFRKHLHFFSGVLDFIVTYLEKILKMMIGIDPQSHGFHEALEGAANEAYNDVFPGKLRYMRSDMILQACSFSLSGKRVNAMD